jgi:hypothetical protein
MAMIAITTKSSINEKPNRVRFKRDLSFSMCIQFVSADQSQIIRDRPLRHRGNWPPNKKNLLLKRTNFEGKTRY